MENVIVKTGTTEVRRYKIAYVNEADGAKRSKISAITEHVAGGDLRKLNLNYQAGQNNFKKSSAFDGYYKAQYYFSDFNGDGLQDYIETTKNYLHFYKNNGNNSFTNIKSINHRYAKQINFGDFNGDGLIDILYSLFEKVYVITNLGNNTFSDPKKYIWDTPRVDRTYRAQNDNDNDTTAPAATYMVGDFNADGISDIAFKKFTRKNKDTMWARKEFVYSVIIKAGKTNGSFDTETIFSNVPARNFSSLDSKDYNALKVGDFNGDGLPDMLFSDYAKGGKIYLNQGSFSFQYGYAPPVKAYSYYMQLADFNGDGMTDILNEVYDGTDQVWINKGKGKFSSINLNVYSKNCRPILMDINGDGYTDIYDYYALGTDTVFLNDGSGKFTKAYTINPSNYLNYADVNGDGFIDLVETTSDGHIWLSQAKNSLLARITNNTDQDIRITYKPMTDKGIYYNYSTNKKRNKYGFNDIANGNIELTTTQPLVYTVNSINGTSFKGGPLAGYNQVRYFYYGYIVNKLRGSQGFHAIYAYDDASNTINMDFYKQIGFKNGSDDRDGFQFTGMPYASYIMDRSDKKYLQKTIITYRDASTHSGSRAKVYEPYTYSNIDLLYDPLTKSSLKNVYHYNTISTDGLGNIVKTVDRTYDAIHKKNFYKTTYNTYGAEDISKWYIGRLTAAKVVHTQTDGHSVTRASSFKYNTHGVLSEEVANAGTSMALTKRYLYDSHGNKIKETISGSGITTASTTYAYSSSYKYKFQTKVTNAAGLSETKTYDPRFGALTSLKGPNGLTTTWTYDGLGRKIKETRADGTTTTWTHLWYQGGVINRYAVYYTTEASSGMPTKNTFYDSLGREYSISHATLGGKRLRASLKYYNAKGELYKEALPYIEGQETPGYIQTTYDNYGRAVKVTKPGPDNSTQTYRSSYAGFTMTTTDPRGYKKQTVKNAVDQTLKITDAYGTGSASSISYTYDAAGNLLTTTDAAGNVIRMTYDSVGNKVTMIDPDLGEWHYIYNAAGKLRLQWSGAAGYNGSKNSTYKTFDILGRVTRQMTYNRQEYNTNNSTYSYNQTNYLYADANAAAGSRGKLIKVTASSRILGEGARTQTITTAYDTKGRATKSTVTISGKGSFVTSTVYDSYSRPYTTTYPNGYRVTNHYSYGILDSIKGSDGKVHYKINEITGLGDIYKASFANGIQTMRLHDNAGFVGTILSGKSAAYTGDVQRIDYSYDRIGNVLTREDTSIANKHITDTFTYDALNRLYSQNTSSDVAGPYAHSRIYRYDKIGNITHNYAYKGENRSGGYLSGEHIGYYSYGTKPHAVTKAGSRVYRYDAVGNMIYRNGDTITYNPINKPAILKNSKGEEVRFYYGVGGARFHKHTDDLDTYYIGKSYEEKDDGNGNIEQIVYLSIGGQTIGTHTEKFNTGFNDPKEKYNHYFHTDALGSITAITNATGKVIERRSYEPFGKIRAMNYGINNNRYANTVIDTTRAFTGHEQIAEFSGLIHMNARLYDSDIGRFLSADTLIQYPEHSQGYNRYAYIENNPLMAPDPTGHGFFSFLGSIFKAIFSSIRTIASIAVAAVIAIYAPQFLSTYFGITAGTFGSIVVTGAIAGFASGLVATGSITGALKGAFWGAIGAAAAFGVAELTANAFNIGTLKAHAATLWKAGMRKIAVFKSMLHGLTRGIISKLQGGRFLSGFMSGVSSMFDVGAQGHGGFVGRTAIMAIVGGTFSMLGGGKFASGALAGAFVHMFNAEGLATRLIRYGRRALTFLGGALQVVVGTGLATTAVGAVVGGVLVTHGLNNMYEGATGNSGGLREAYNSTFGNGTYTKVDLGLSVAGALPSAISRVGVRSLGTATNTVKAYVPLRGY